MFTRNNPVPLAALCGRQPVTGNSTGTPARLPRQTRPDGPASDCRPDPRGCPFVPLTLASRLVRL